MQRLVLFLAKLSLTKYAIYDSIKKQKKLAIRFEEISLPTKTSNLMTLGLKIYKDNYSTALIFCTEIFSILKEI